MVGEVQVSPALSAALDAYAKANRDLGYGVSINTVLSLRVQIDTLIAEIQPAETFDDGTSRGCCGEFETGSGEHGEECAEAGR